MCYDAEFFALRSNGTSVITEIRPKKNDPLRPAFQGHSKSPEPTRIHRLRYLWLPINIP